MEILKKYKTDIIIFIILFIILSLIAILFVQTPDWDFYNYHYHNGYAFLNHRVGFDFLAANFRGYLNPYADTLIYILVKLLKNHPYIFLSIMTFDNAFFLFMIYKIANYVLETDNTKKIIYSLLCVLFVAFSPIMIDSLNFSMNDIMIANFTMISIYIFIKNIFTDSKNRKKLIFLSGIFLGIALGLKLTHGIYCITFILCILILHKKIPSFIKTFSIYISGILIAFILTDGYWMYLMCKLYDNPFFPYYNDIFKSKYFDPINICKFEYTSILPRNIFEYFFYPFFLPNDKIHNWGNYRLDWDPRYAINFLCILFFSVYIFLNKKKDINFNIIKKENLYFLLLFVFLSFYINTFFAAIYRFIFPTYGLYGIILLVCCILICNLLKCKKILTGIVLFILFGIFSYTTSTYVNLDYPFKKPFKKGAKLFYNDQKFEIKDDSYVILMNMPTSYVAVEQNKKAKYYGFVLPSHLFQKYKENMLNIEKVDFYSHYMFSDYLENELKSILSNNNKIYIIYNDCFFHEKIYEEALDFYSGGTRKMKNCKEIRYKGIVTYDEYVSFICDFD